MPKSSRYLAEDPVPRYHKVYTILRGEIVDGRFPPEAPLPGELELATLFDVSRMTIRRALDRLQREELVDRRHGAGTFVRAPKARRTQQAIHTGFIDNLLLDGLRNEVCLLEFGYVRAPDKIARCFGLEPSAMVLKAVRLRSHQARPILQATTYLPEKSGRLVTREDFEADHLLVQLGTACGGFATAHQRISAIASEPAVAAILDVDFGSPLLKIVRVVRDAQDRVVKHLCALCRPDAYEFALDLCTDFSPDGPVWQPSLPINPRCLPDGRSNGADRAD